MTNTVVQVPPDSSGSKLQMRSYTRGANTVLSQGVYWDGLPTFRVLAWHLRFSRRIDLCADDCRNARDSERSPRDQSPNCRAC